MVDCTQSGKVSMTAYLIATLRLIAPSLNKDILFYSILCSSLRLGDFYTCATRCGTGCPKKKYPFEKYCITPSQIIQIKCHLAVLQPTYIGITMQILLSLHKVFWVQWMDKVKVAIFKVNTNYKYCQKQTSWWFYVFGSKMRTKNDWDAVEPILELLMFGELEQRVEVSNFCKFQNPDPLFWIDSLNNEMTHSIKRPTLKSHCIIVTI